ncbi:MAG: lanthionine synthetase LanC family protein, partial [Myxococcota bacterium]
GRGWWTPPALIPAQQKPEHADGYWNLGVAHGVPGVVGLYASILAADAAGPGTEQMRTDLREAVRFVVAHERDEAPRYPWAVRSVAAAAPPSRTAWCYGDLGIALVLAKAAAVDPDPTNRARVIRLAQECARRSPQACQVRDAGFCHGAAGLAHGLNRLYQATADEVLAVAARTWFTRLMSGRGARGLAGFPAWHEGRWRDDPTVLTGAAGVALSLIAATSHDAPQWDARFLADVPPLALAE